MKVFYFVLALTLTMCINAQINYRFEIVNLILTGCDDGFGDEEEPTWKVWAKDNTNASWEGGHCHTQDGNIPVIHIPNATNALLLNKTNTSATTIEIKFDAWEDDSFFASDRCAFNSGDDCRQNHEPLVGNGGIYAAIVIQNATMCQWTNYTYTVGDFEITVRLSWEYHQFSGGPTITGCGSAPVAMQGVGSGSWTIFSGSGGGITDNFNPTSDFVGLGGEMYDVIWSSLPNCLTQHPNDTVSVSLYDLPLPNLQASSNLFCEGVPVNFTAQNGLNYDFFVDSIPNLVESNTVGTYTFIPTAGNNAIIVEIYNGFCLNTQQISFTVQETPQPEINFDGILLSSVDVFPFYQWYLNGNPILGATTQTHIPTQNGTYSLEVGLSNGCTNTSSFLLSSLTITENMNSLLSVYPNPAQNHIYLGVNSSTNYTIFDYLGQIVQRDVYKGSIDISNLSNGWYLIKIEQEEQTITKIFEIIR
jgi:hypothetical protein